MKDIIFLQPEDVLLFHQEEMNLSHSKPIIRDKKALDAALHSPQASFQGKFLMDIFEMAATYANSICFNHPFLDGNKRVAAISSISFLYLNGLEFNEEYSEDLADTILLLVNKKLSKTELAKYFKTHSRKL